MRKRKMLDLSKLTCLFSKWNHHDAVLFLTLSTKHLLCLLFAKWSCHSSACFGCANFWTESNHLTFACLLSFIYRFVILLLMGCTRVVRRDGTKTGFPLCSFENGTPCKLKKDGRKRKSWPCSWFVYQVCCTTVLLHKAQMMSWCPDWPVKHSQSIVWPFTFANWNCHAEGTHK